MAARSLSGGGSLPLLGGPHRPIAVLAAMPEELAALTPELRNPSRARVGPFEAVRGTAYGRVVLAAVSGVGKVNAAAVTQRLLAEGAGALLFTGVAGALDPELRPFDLVIADDAVQHDVDVGALGYAPGQVPGEPPAWSADPALADLAAAAAGDACDGGHALAGDGAGCAEGERRPRVVRGRIASGDRFVADPEERARIRAAFGAVCAEMEGAAAAQICARWGVPWAIVRSISDGADGDASVDFRAFTERAAGAAAQVVLGVLRRLPSEREDPGSLR